ncbi:DUF1552 domain-containing protein [Marinagarivorans algicola]|uniref:DUF1552 domain-containing protein n=1 Tax=Marinagarivorans algicola TaxID=1513270 RepID=UPI0006B4F636|nr:DUF1552 domain-containing protein [Marinagarivorans algicola]
MKKINRRALLRNIVTTTSSLPFLYHLPSLGAQEAPKKRLITTYSPNGTTPSEYFPSGSENNFQFKRILKPLEAFKAEMMVFKGVNIVRRGRGGEHPLGTGQLWTASELLPKVAGEEGEGDVGWASGPSIDQVVANHIGGNTAYRSLEYAIAAGATSEVRTRVIYKGSSDYIEPEQNPFAAFERLYGANSPFAGDADAQRTVRASSVLDKVIGDFNYAKRYLSAQDAVLLEAHTEYVRDIEKRLQVVAPQACDIPMLGQRIDPQVFANMPQVFQLFSDLLASAFACGQTQVGSLQWTRSGGQGYPFINVNAHHNSAHEPYGTPGSEHCIVVNTWFNEQLAYLLKALKNMPDPSGEGSLLDHTLVVSGNELGEGNNHSHNNIPFVMAGNLDGHFKMGRYLDYSRQGNKGYSHSRLLVSIQQAFGIQKNSFGNFNEGPLPNLT